MCVWVHVCLETCDADRPNSSHKLYVRPPHFFCIVSISFLLIFLGLSLWLSLGFFFVFYVLLILFLVFYYGVDFLFTYDEDEHNQYVAIEDMINSDGYSFDEWYCITEDDLIPDAVDAYNDWVTNGEAEMNAIYASHITVTESVPETETEEVVEETTEEPTETAPEETEVQETEEETVDQSGNIPVPNYTPTGNFWNTPGSYSSNDGQTLSLSMFTEDGGVEGWCGNINGGSVGSLEVFNYGDKIYYLKKADSSYSNFTDSGYAFTLEPSGETLDIYGETYDKLLLKLYYNGVLQGEYYETDLYQS